MSETIAIPEPAKKTSEGEYNHTSPKTTGMKTAAIWFIVNDTPELDAKITMALGRDTYSRPCHCK